MKNIFLTQNWRKRTTRSGANLTRELAEGHHGRKKKINKKISTRTVKVDVRICLFSPVNIYPRPYWISSPARGDIQLSGELIQ